MILTGWLFGCAVVAGLTLRGPLGDALFITRYTGYLMPWLLVVLLPGAVWAWLARHRWLAAVLIASAVTIVLIHVPLFRRHREVPTPSASRLSVMSYNTWSRNRDDARIANVILSHQPDILLLQEVPPKVFGRVMDRLRDLYGGSRVYSAYEHTLQQAVVSRYPVESSASLDEKGKSQKVVLRSPSGPVTVFNVHPLRTGGWRYRYEQIASLLEEDVLREKAPVVLGGDLNAPEHSQLYRLIAGHLENAHREAGFGFGFTYPSPSVRWLGLFPVPSLVRIDHIFFSDQFVALRAGTIAESGGSDHRPVFAELGLQSHDLSGSSLRRLGRRPRDPAHCAGRHAAGDPRRRFGW